MIRLIATLASLGAVAMVNAGATSTAPAACGWKPVRVPPGDLQAYLRGISALSENDVWIVGSIGARTLALHFDGRALRVVPTPSPYLTADLRSVVAFAPDDVWAVGEGVTRKKPYYHYTPIVLRYDGTRWRQVPVPVVSTGFGMEPQAMAGAAPNDVWLVGTARAHEADDWVGRIEHWDGTRWRVVSAPSAEYFTVTAIAPNDVWAAGSASFPYRPNLEVAHWNGLRWRLMRDTAQDGWDTTARASSASESTNLWVVGDVASGPFAEQFDGARFTNVPIPYAHWRANYRNQDDSYLDDVAAVSPGDVWAVGNFGIEHYDGVRWQLSSRDASLSAIEARTPTDVWAAGDGEVLHLACT